MAAKAKTKKITNSAMDKAMAEWEKTYGAGSLELDDKVVAYDVIPTGSLELDFKLGVGGLVMGRTHEWWGPDGIGKSTLGYEALAEAQRKYPDRLVGYIDVEQKHDKSWMDAHGINRKRCLIYTPESAEDVADALKDMLRKFKPSMIMLDSIGAMVPEAEKEKDADAAVIAAQAKIVTRMVKIAAVEARLANTAVLFINQVRANVSGFGAATQTGGGFALRHVTTTKVKFQGTDTTYFVGSGDNKQRVGHMLAAKIERNNVAPAYKTARISLFHIPTDKFGPIGVDRVTEAITLGLATKVIEQQGGGYYVNSLTGERVKGREALEASLRLDRDAVDDIRTAVLATVADTVYEEEQPTDEAAIESEIAEGSFEFRGTEELKEASGSDGMSSALAMSMQARQAEEA